MALQGDTVRLEVEFKDFDGNAVEPEGVSLNLYDDNEIAFDTVNIPDENRFGIGQYYFDYVVPYGRSDFIVYEFYGSHRGRPILARNKLPIEFV